jgi:hypothetical protein
MTADRLASPGLDTATPNIARMWNYQLGGKDNFAVDREAADALNQAMREAGVPGGREVAKENRAFIRRAVRFLVGAASIRQFLDIGSGLPTMGNVHEIAHELNPAARVIYVDYDPMVLAHGRVLLANGGNVAVVQADMREPDTILAHPELRDVLDLDEPVAVLLVAALHLLTDDEDPHSVVDKIRHAMVPGSYLALTHVTWEARPQAAAVLADEFQRLKVSTPIVPRGREEILRFFDGFELVEPGLVFPSHWRPGKPSALDHPGAGWMFAGVGKRTKTKKLT